jgi:WD40 repeat protein
MREQLLHGSTNSEDSGSVHSFNRMGAFAMPVLRLAVFLPLCLTTLACGKSDLEQADHFSPPTNYAYKVLSGFEGVQNQMSLSKDNRTLATCGANGRVLIWDLAEHKIVRELNNDPSMLQKLQFSLDDCHLLGLTFDGRLRQWNARSLDAESDITIKGIQSVTDVAIIPNIGTVVSTMNPYEPNPIRKVEILTGLSSPAVGNCDAPVWALAVDCQFKYLAAACTDGQVRTWELASKKMVASLRHPNEVITMTAAFSPDGELVATGGSDGIGRLFRRRTGDLICAFPCAVSYVSCILFSPKSNYIYFTGGGGDSEKGILTIIDLPRIKLIGQLRLHKTPIVAMCISSDGSMLITSGQDSVIGLWRTSMLK